MEKARWTTLSEALFALICFFLPWALLSLYLWMELCWDVN